MSWLPLSFGAPMVLWGLLALPVIWWLLRLTPPKPQTEVFPPLRILARVLKREETPQQSPWWLTLLRLLMAALIVAALAEPVFNPREKLSTEGEALALVIDNDWASADDWERRVATASRLIADAERNSVPVLLAFTAEKPNQQIGPFSAAEARDRLNAVKPRPVPADRREIYARVGEALRDLPPATVAVLTDGLAADGDEAAFSAMMTKPPANFIWGTPQRLDTIGLTAADNGFDRLTISAVRASSNATGPASMSAGAFDDKGRRIGDAAIAFRPGQTIATGDFVVPFELRNDFASIALDGVASAGAVRVLDESAKRRRIGLLSETPVDEARLLLSPLYYIRRAMEPFADIVEPTSPAISEAIPQLLQQKPAVIVMADVGTVPEPARTALVEWMENGGTLLRFAGSHLLSAGDDSELLPVILRRSERSLGGALSWTEPQPVGEFPANGPFSSLPAPTDVTVTRQLLAEPTPDLIDHTWATLADGTPLVTGDRRGKGMVVLFHVPPEATWSNLPISGSFVEMLRRIVQLSRNQGAVAAAPQSQTASLAPYRMIDASGAIVPPGPDARPLMAGQAAVTVDNPPGLYGSEEGVVAHNLLAAEQALTPIVRPQLTIPVADLHYSLDEARDLKGPLVAAAILLMVLDTLAVFWIGGLFSRWRRRPRMAGTTAALLVMAAISFGHVDTARANDAKPGDAEAIDAINQTRIAYVITGEPGVDSISRAGLEGLRRFLIEKTALEPGEPAGVDISRDELSFYPLIYWPIDPAAPEPDTAAMARVEAYMQQGGTVLFDTRDQFSTGFGSDSASPATQRLRSLLSTLSVPPLEPVPSDHVLTKSFFILNEFPGRFNGSPLWIEASLDASNTDNRPVRTGDGVSPIMITANDMAGAWAIDANGEPLLPTVPSDPMQRVYAMRAGVNIVIYMLTGNYKSDQVHVPALLERLGQ
ncbi:RNA-binding protein [Mesorhizobium sp. Root554]|uniref:DUF4159 domain-containing protein n=1 Tax=unclassified Mesorhizobium TaxID=325217 RepID=UPI0006F6D54C|nr:MULTISPECIES: DUF4159 domain-containing protein [unclassified Mesorhizobium]KQZ14284.1 RNA-binding protein [Mesorhizobium sp. Root1471]KQZ36795.1 RNA-binding protein [Mesorhizobium sp. Root554]